jgi:glutamate racemase
MSFSMPVSTNDLPIGVFDSGVGGLTVLRALRRLLPNEHFVYLGDTARLPYGTKSAESIQRYSLQAAGALTATGVKCLVIACNTASSVALPTLAKRFDAMPVIGVVEPGARAGCERSRHGSIAVVATESTVRGGAYQRAIAQLRPDARVTATACALFVALAEEGWTDGSIVESVAHRYLAPLFDEADRPDTLVLGCTHFPVLSGAIRNVLPVGVNIVDSAETTASTLLHQLAASGLKRVATEQGTVRFLATDGPERFARVGSLFLGETIDAQRVELVDLLAVADSARSG